MFFGKTLQRHKINPVIPINNKPIKNFYNDLLITLRLFIIICKLFCTIPIDILVRIKLNKFLRVLIKLYYLFIIIMLIITTYYQQIQFDITMELLQRFLYICEYVFTNVNIIIIIVGINRRKDDFLIILNNIIVIDKLLHRNYNISPNYTNVKWFIGCALILYKIFFLFVIFIDYKYNNDNLVNFLRSSTVYTITNIIIILSLTQYTLVNYIIMKRLSVIIGILQDFYMNKSSAINMNLIKLRLIYKKLLLLYNKINNLFSLLIITILLSCFIILNIQLYAIYQYSEYNQTQNLYLFIYTILWIVLHLGKILLILLPNYFIENVKEKLCNILYDIDTGYEKTDIMIQDEIQKFSLQLLHDKKHQIALGIVSLDLTLLATMLGSLTTYLVILIQFDISSKQQQQQNNCIHINNTNNVIEIN